MDAKVRVIFEFLQVDIRISFMQATIAVYICASASFKVRAKL